MSLLRRIQNNERCCILLEHRTVGAAIETASDWRDFLLGVQNYSSRTRDETLQRMAGTEAMVARHRRKWHIYRGGWWSILKRTHPSHDDNIKRFVRREQNLVLLVLHVPVEQKVRHLIEGLAAIYGHVTYEYGGGSRRSELQAGVSVVGFAPRFDDISRLTTAINSGTLPNHLHSRNYHNQPRYDLPTLGLHHVERRGVRFEMRFAFSETLYRLPMVLDYLRLIGLEDLDLRVEQPRYRLRLIVSGIRGEQLTRVLSCLDYETRRAGRVSRPWHRNPNVDGESWPMPDTRVQYKSAGTGHLVVEIETPYRGLEELLFRKWIQHVGDGHVRCDTTQLL
jgi:hypothetical protein